MSKIYDIEVTDINNQNISLAEFKGKSLLIVNVASKCGFTPQYEGLEKIYQENKDKGLVILGFPCNQFGKQEPGNEEEIKNLEVKIKDLRTGKETNIKDENIVNEIKKIIWKYIKIDKIRRF